MEWKVGKSGNCSTYLLQRLVFLDPPENQAKSTARLTLLPIMESSFPIDVTLLWTTPSQTQQTPFNYIHSTLITAIHLQPKLAEKVLAKCWTCVYTRGQAWTLLPSRCHLSEVVWEDTQAVTIATLGCILFSASRDSCVENIRTTLSECTYLLSQTLQTSLLHHGRWKVFHYYN